MSEEEASDWAKSGLRRRSRGNRGIGWAGLFAQWPSFYCLSLPERLPAGPLGSFHDGQGKYACSNTHHSGPKTGPNPSPVHLAASNTLAPPTLLRKKEPMGFSSYDCMNKT